MRRILDLGLSLSMGILVLALAGCGPTVPSRLKVGQTLEPLTCHNFEYTSTESDAAQVETLYVGYQTTRFDPTACNTDYSSALRALTSKMAGIGFQGEGVGHCAHEALDPRYSVFSIRKYKTGTRRELLDPANQLHCLAYEGERIQFNFVAYLLNQVVASFHVEKWKRTDARTLERSPVILQREFRNLAEAEQFIIPFVDPRTKGVEDILAFVRATNPSLTPEIQKFIQVPEDYSVVLEADYVGIPEDEPHLRIPLKEKQFRRGN